VSASPGGDSCNTTGTLVCDTLPRSLYLEYCLWLLAHSAILAIMIWRASPLSTPWMIGTFAGITVLFSRIAHLMISLAATQVVSESACVAGSDRGNRQAWGSGPADGHRACNVRQEGYCALVRRCRSCSVEPDRARKREPVALKAAVGPVVSVGFEDGGLRNARVRIKKNTKQALAPYVGFYGHSFLLSAELSCGTWNEMLQG
jgi:hypothetical protein